MKSREELLNSLSFLLNRKIVLYGTGKNTRNLIRCMPELNIVGILDRVQMDGELDGIQIIDWDDIGNGEIYAIVICSSKKHEISIGERIMIRCIGLNIHIFNMDGDDIEQVILKKSFYESDFFLPDGNYINKNIHELKKKIESYDAISFDLFDTLIMRRTLLPTDVFQIVEEKASKIGIQVHEFKKKRRTAELMCPYGNIYDIYVKLGEVYGLGSDVCEILKELELETEKEVLIPRYDMVAIMRQAYELGKKVSIISDMYIPSTMLKEILGILGITFYSNIYVSCEYHCSKANGLFEVYKKDINDDEIKLHIGDNWDADIVGAQKSNVDAYYVMNSYDLLMKSNWKRLLKYENSFGCREIIGYICSELLNSPFALNSQQGIVCMSSAKEVINTFVSPIANLYVGKLCKHINSHKYKGILLGARDGFLVKKILDECFEKSEVNIPYFYFLTSRKIILRTTAGVGNNFEWIKRYSVDKKLSKILGDLFDEKIDPMEEEEEYVERVTKAVMSKANRKKTLYLDYLQSLNIDLGEKYLFCDLISSGTVHRGINKLFQQEQDGFYLYNIKVPGESELKVYSVYETEQYNEVSGSVNILEKFFTSLAPSVEDIDINGNFIFEVEERSQAELNMVQKSYEWIVEWINNNLRLRDECIDVPAGFWLDLLNLKDKVCYVGEALFITKLELWDNVTGQRLNVI